MASEWMNKVSGRLKSVSDVFKRGKPLAESLPTMLDPGDPRVVIRPLGRDWLCPFSGIRIQTPTWNGSSLTLLKCHEVMEHLLKQPELQKLGSNAVLKSWDDLVQITLFMRFEHGGNYKVMAKDGEWVCPYCLETTNILIYNWDGSEAPVHMFIPKALEHFKTCEEYIQDPLGAKSTDDIARLGGDRLKITKLIKKDPRMRLMDNKGSWFCPYSERFITAINLRNEEWDTPLHDKIIEYVLGPNCPARYSQFEIERTMEVLQASLVKATKMKPI